MNTKTALPTRDALICLLLAPFYLNDFASIYITDWRLWLFIDYVFVKLFPLALIAWMINSRYRTPEDLGLKKQNLMAFVLIFLGVTVIGTLIDQNGYTLLAGVPGYGPLGGMPAITSTTWDWIDLTLGLLLVGVVEELVFRGYLHGFLSRFTQSNLMIILASSLAFGLIHWSLGFTAVLVTTIIGAVFMMAYIATKSLIPIALAHFAINFIDFAGVIPKSIFKLP